MIDIKNLKQNKKVLSYEDILQRQKVFEDKLTMITHEAHEKFLK